MADDVWWIAMARVRDRLHATPYRPQEPASFRVTKPTEHIEVEFTGRNSPLIAVPRQPGQLRAVVAVVQHGEEHVPLRREVNDGAARNGAKPSELKGAIQIGMHGPP